MRVAPTEKHYQYKSGASCIRGCTIYYCNAIKGSENTCPTCGVKFEQKELSVVDFRGGEPTKGRHLTCAPELIR
jgi:hypothetical protein